MVPAVVFFFGIMPALSFLGRWDSYLSFSLYSGNLDDCDIQIDPADFARMPPAVRAATDPNSGAVDQTAWSNAELGAMPYPEHRIALNVGRSLARRARHGPVLVELDGKPNIRTGQIRSQYFCCPPGGGPPREISSDAYDKLSAP